MSDLISYVCSSYLFRPWLSRLSLPSSPIGCIYVYAMAAQGISVFVYDKRGTGGSEGEYTQNFELLAADAAKALDTARGMTAGRHGRAGFFGGSQGGRVAPLAAKRAKADFVAVGLGLGGPPTGEEREPRVWAGGEDGRGEGGEGGGKR